MIQSITDRKQLIYPEYIGKGGYVRKISSYDPLQALAQFAVCNSVQQILGFFKESLNA